MLSIATAYAIRASPQSERRQAGAGQAPVFYCVQYYGTWQVYQRDTAHFFCIEVERKLGRALPQWQSGGGRIGEEGRRCDDVM